jgi:hypothetical protein
MVAFILGEKEERRAASLKRFNDDANTYRFVLVLKDLLTTQDATGKRSRTRTTTSVSRYVGALYGTKRILSDLSPFFIISSPS